ncbi:MAG: FtsX-like permease family protein [Chlamydiales bacterium]|nr:FtsX-like permease family protein [Chlamydiales bacterium]
MRFELTVALKYLIPRWRQLSVSIISLISVLVISLVVWLVVLFLSVTDGIEKKWVEQLVALNAPVRMAPTDAYYRSYYYQIDRVSLESNYTPKTIGEKLAASLSDPYDPAVDIELPYDFPAPDRHPDGSLKDPVKEAWEAVGMLKAGAIRPQEYEVTFGNLRLGLVRDGIANGETQQTFLTQVSYIASHDEKNKQLKQMLVPPSKDDYNNILYTLSHQTQAAIDEANQPPVDSLIENPTSLSENLKNFFSHVSVTKLRPTAEGFILPPAFFPEKGYLEGVAIVRHNEICKVVIPQTKQEVGSLNARLQAFGLETTSAKVIFDQKQMHLSSEMIASSNVQLILNDTVSFQSKLISSSLESADALSSLKFEISGNVQGTSLLGSTSYENLEIAEAHPIENPDATPPFWLYADHEGNLVIPTDQIFGEGVLVAKHFQSSGIRLGDRGYLSYYTPTTSSMQEQRIPIYVSGFYDPGMMPIGSKLLFVDPGVVALLRGNISVSDPMLGNGINIWLNDITEAESVKNQLIHALESREIAKYWDVLSFEDYEFARPVLQQLKSDKNLFTLIAIIILIVACSNIISMLILLVNDKRREIGILQSIGASPKRIAAIFGICGFTMGVISCVLGSLAAIFTLRYLQSLVNFLSFIQGHEAFQSAFYGSHLPNELSFTSLLFVIGATLLISLLAGIVPAIKAARIRPSEILRAE